MEAICYMAMWLLTACGIVAWVEYDTHNCDEQDMFFAVITAMAWPIILPIVALRFMLWLSVQLGKKIRRYVNG